MNSVRNAFRREKLFSVDEIKESFKLYMKHILANEDGDDTSRLIQNKIKLCKQFYKKIEKCHLPELNQEWWFYEYEYTGTGFELWMRSINDIELDENGIISTCAVDEEFMLFAVECDYLSVDEFASVQGVSPVTVRQWIRRGKLRYAKKLGGEWRIPATSDKPERGFHFVQYFLDETNPPYIEAFPLVQYSQCVTIHQCLDNKAIFKCSFEGKKMDKDILLSRSEVEELELALISSGKAKPEIPIQWVPDKEQK